MAEYDRPGPGRPPLTDELIGTIAKLVVMGVDPPAAAATLGVTATTYDEWMIEGKLNARGQWRQRRLMLAVEKALAQCETQLISKIRSAANEN